MSKRRRRKRKSNEIRWLSQFAVLQFCRLAVVDVDAEDGGKSDDDSNTANNNYNNNKAVSSSTSTEKGQVIIQDFCTRNYIQVDYLSILCDTPGAYYYGSNAYRNSKVCMSGDKAHLDIVCK